MERKYSPKKTAKFAAVQSGLLNLLPKDQLSQAKKHTKKAKEAVASCWLSFDESVKTMVQEFIAHLQTFEFFQESDATASGLLTQTRSHKFISTLYKTLQHREGLPSAVSYCLAKLDDVLRRKDELLTMLSVDLSENGKLALAGIAITAASTTFLSNLITSYVTKLKENILARFPSLPLVKAFSIFDLQLLSPCKGSPRFQDLRDEPHSHTRESLWCHRVCGSRSPYV